MPGPVAWLFGTALSAAIAWFGIAGAIRTAQPLDRAIAVPTRATVPAVGVTRSPVPSTREPVSVAHPTPTPTRRSTPRVSTAASPRASSAGVRPGSIVTRTVPGGSATISVEADSARLISATPWPGYEARATRRAWTTNGVSSGWLTIEFIGADTRSVIRVEWDASKRPEITTTP